jgi:class 3 adenylate cyclase/tetratricopeptide (TPR) repeat protein
MRFCGHCGAPGQSPEAASAAAAFPGLDEERRLVTALFADLSGFSRLATALDPERLAEVIDPILASLAQIVERYEGHVEKFAGDALLALFGAPVAHEDDAVRAQLAALDMHAAAAQWAATPGLPPAGLPLHIGINSGQVVARTFGSSVRLDYGVLGDAVVLAQRLQASAPAGQTYVGQATHQLTESEFVYESLPPVKVRGRPGPVSAWRLTGAAARIAEGRRRLDGPRRPLVGRADELAAGAAVLSAGGILVISGEAGIGKSRLVEALHEQAADRGIRWLASRCPAHGTAQAYSAFRGLAHQLPSAPQSPLRMLRGEQPPGMPTDPELLRATLHRAVLGALQKETQGGPVVLAVEDVHWIDPSSATLAAEIATLATQSLATQSPLLLLMTTRDPGPVLDTVLGAIGKNARRELALTPLDPGDIGELARVELGAPADRALLALLSERTGGNALFAVEIVREMRERGELDATRDVVRLRPEVRAEDVPNSVQGILSARLDLLSAGAAAALKVCAAIGRRVPRDILAALLGSEADQTSGAIEELQARGLLTAEGDAVAFAHALVQEVAYARLLQRQRRELHGRVADAIIALRGDTDETIDLLARHLALAGAGPEAVAALRRAADRARRLYANDEAHRLLRQASELADELVGEADAALPAAERAELGLSLAELADLLGNYDEAQQLYQEVRRGTGVLAAWRGEAAVLRKRGRCDEVLALLDEANATLHPRPQVRGLLELERGRALVAAGRFGEATDVLTTALPLLAPGSDDAAQCLVQLARAQLGPGNVQDARRSAEAARELFERWGNVRGQATALRVLGNIYQELHREDDAVNALTAGLEAAGRLGDVEERGACLVNLGLLELSRDRLEDAARWNHAAISEFERVGHRRGAAIAHANLADTLGRQGGLDAALRHCALAAEAARSVQDDLTIADVQATQASILLAQGRPEDAAAQALEAAERFRAVSDVTAAGEALELAARGWDAAGQPDRAEAARNEAAGLATAEALAR